MILLNEAINLELEQEGKGLEEMIGRMAGSETAFLPNMSWQTVYNYYTKFVEKGMDKIVAAFLSASNITHKIGTEYVFELYNNLLSNIMVYESTVSSSELMASAARMTDSFLALQKCESENAKIVAGELTENYMKFRRNSSYDFSVIDSSYMAGSEYAVNIGELSNRAESIKRNGIHEGGIGITAITNPKVQSSLKIKIAYFKLIEEGGLDKNIAAELIGGYHLYLEEDEINLTYNLAPLPEILTRDTGIFPSRTSAASFVVSHGHKHKVEGYRNIGYLKNTMLS